MKKQINKNQLNIFENTMHGYQYYKDVDFYGSDYKVEKDKYRLNTKFLKVFSIVKNLGIFTNNELYKITRPFGINDDTASRCVRRIDEINFMGYAIFKNEKTTPITFECKKLDK